MEDWEKAGKIASEALLFGKSLVKPGAMLSDVSEKIEKKIEELKGKPAFPVTISINEVAAHALARKDDIFNKGDLVKLDVGAHVNGCIADNALTIDLGSNAKLVEASEKALEEAIKKVKIGVKVRELGKAIEQTIKSYGFNPVKNLSGHQIEKFQEHAKHGVSIPNYDNEDESTIEKGMIIAIEPFATEGPGIVEEGKDSGIYEIVNFKNVRSDISREILGYILDNYQTLPFSKDWLLKDFPEFKVNFAVRMLEKDGIIYHHKQLVEKGKAKVSQAEHTLLVDDEIKVLTKR